MSEENKWQSANGGDSKIVRWEENDKPEVMEKTVYVGKVVQGIYFDKKEDIGAKKGTLFVIRTTEHGDLSIWGSIVLKDAFSKITLGSEVKVESLGKVKTKDGQNEYFNFDVMCREAPMKSATSSVNPEMPPV